ncbi:hypothetical protein Q1W73_09785 [Asticcacaulis sp. ZE23SCel15]|uniref:hypothetical protein n=1 Tax=Asticcacaulis sp. ZE23SCel15 TaxID=3059027 RepID=UPI00265DA129|nr:hypothetical protein [Asticcacaulis sp. ZE23SCel15]WKL55992.1 hypothetical protein Q1W73_09785 [Asticcacaulis sp. ZE23SCel15]
MKKSEVVLAGAEKMHQTENAIDLALSEAGELLSTLARLRATSGMSAMFGQDALMCIVDNTRNLALVRGGFLEAHKELKKIHTTWAKNVVLTGNDFDKPENDKKTGGGGAGITTGLAITT